MPYALTNSQGNPAGPIQLGGAATAIAVGDFHACAILQDQSVRCWGFNASGQLGLGNANASTYENLTPAQIGAVPIGGNAVAISAGAKNTCVLLGTDAGASTGPVECWGNNTYGQLGLDTAANVSASEAPGDAGTVMLSTGTSAVATHIFVGYYTVCAVFGSGQVQCWGDNGTGQVGIGNNTNSGTGPCQIDGGACQKIGDNETPASVGPVPLAQGSRRRRQRSEMGTRAPC